MKIIMNFKFIVKIDMQYLSKAIQMDMLHLKIYFIDKALASTNYNISQDSERAIIFL